MGLTYVIADLHGRLDLLLRAIELIEADAGDAGGTFVVLGDFVDRGPQSSAIIERLMTGPQRAGWAWIVLQGNHEAMMLEALSNPTPHLMRWWVGNGGGETLRSYGYEQGDELSPFPVMLEQHLAWIENLPITHEDGRRIYVHAGVPSHQSVAAAKQETLQWMLYPSEDSYPDAEVHDDAQHMSGKHIVHGHHQSASHPLLKPHRTNLDSFAWKTGRLAIGVFDDEQAAPVKIMDAIGRPM